MCLPISNLLNAEMVEIGRGRPQISRPLSESPTESGSLSDFMAKTCSASQLSTAPLTPPASPKDPREVHRSSQASNRMAIDFMAPASRPPEQSDISPYYYKADVLQPHANAPATWFIPPNPLGGHQSRPFSELPDASSRLPPLQSITPGMPEALPSHCGSYSFSSSYSNGSPEERRYSIGSADHSPPASAYHGTRRAPRPPYESKETYLIMFLRVDRGLRWDQVLDVFQIVFARNQNDDDGTEHDTYRSESGLSSVYYRKREEPYWNLGKVRKANASADKAKVRARLRSEGYLSQFLQLLEDPAIQQIIRKPKQEQFGGH